MDFISGSQENGVLESQLSLVVWVQRRAWGSLLNPLRRIVRAVSEGWSFSGFAQVRLIYLTNLINTPPHPPNKKQTKNQPKTTKQTNKTFSNRDSLSAFILKCEPTFNSYFIFLLLFPSFCLFLVFKRGISKRKLRKWISLSTLLYLAQKQISMSSMRNEVIFIAGVKRSYSIWEDNLEVYKMS